METTTTSRIHVLVIAHPDDESMFFIPTIRALVAANETVWLLCLTTGDYDGLGKIREKELDQASKLLGIKRVICKDDLKDHPTERWSASCVARGIQKALIEHAPDNCEQFVLLTFDRYGVSGHVNHIDTHYGVCDLVRQNNPIRTSSKNEIALEAWQLDTERNILIKYLPVLSWGILLLSFIVTSLSLTTSSIGECCINRCHQPLLNWRAMATHKSQFVWYRRLFVVFSCYTYVNKLRPIDKTSFKTE